jgi:hypothetical protein
MLEINVGGVYVPALLMWAGIAFLLTRFIERACTRVGFHELIWHRALFDLAVFVILWGAISAGAYHIAFSGVSLSH